MLNTADPHRFTDDPHAWEDGDLEADVDREDDYCEACNALRDAAGVRRDLYCGECADYLAGHGIAVKRG